jgi:hypothetical protein
MRHMAVLIASDPIRAHVSSPHNEKGPGSLLSLFLLICLKQVRNLLFCGQIGPPEHQRDQG